MDEWDRIRVRKGVAAKGWFVEEVSPSGAVYLYPRVDTFEDAWRWVDEIIDARHDAVYYGEFLDE